MNKFSVNYNWDIKSLLGEFGAPTRYSTVPQIGGYWKYAVVWSGPKGVFNFGDGIRAYIMARSYNDFSIIFTKIDAKTLKEVEHSTYDFLTHKQLKHIIHSFLKKAKKNTRR